MAVCYLCPRNCGVDRSLQKGYCQSPDSVFVARAALHMWEEPCISGANGSGTVFFSGCNMKCIYCQNRDIAIENFGKEVSIQRLSQIFSELQSKGANNINLVTPTHYADKIISAVDIAKKSGLKIPVVYNTGGYEKTETIYSLGDTVDVFMPDFKYWENSTALELSNAPDYTDTAKKALDAMVELQGELIYDERGILQRGVIVRHLVLPEHVYEAKRIAEYVLKRYGNRVLLSLMSQYTPVTHHEKLPFLNRSLRKKEYDSLINYVIDLGGENVYIQEGSSASESFIPPFTLDGV